MRSFSGAAVKTCEKNGGQTDPGGRPGGGGQCGSPPAQLESGIGENSAHSHRARLMFPSSLDHLPQKKKKRNPLLFTKLLLLSRFSRVRLCATPWTAAHQAPLPLGFSSKNTGVGCHCLLRCLPKAEIKMGWIVPFDLRYKERPLGQMELKQL